MADRGDERVPLMAVREQNAELSDALRDAVFAVIASGQLAQGPEVAAFEREFAAYVGSAHCVAVRSGTEALHLALRVCDIGPGDEVVTTPLTWISTAWAVSYVGATPVFADVDAESGNLDPACAAAAIAPRTRALLPVHLYGQAAPIEALRTLSDARGIVLLEDTAQAAGAEVGERRLGSFGRLGCFSFHPVKNLGALGEGGAVVTDDAALAERLRALRDHAQHTRHRHEELGFNARMDEIQGAALRVKLRRLDAWNAARRKVAAQLRGALADLPDVALPPASAGPAHVWHLFVIRVPDREDLRRHLDARGIDTAVHYPTPVHLQPAYRELGLAPGSLPRAEAFAASCLSLPMSPYLDTTAVQRIAAAVREWAERRA